MLRYLLRRDGPEDLRDLGLANVDEHVSVREPLHRALERRLRRRMCRAVRSETLATKVVLEDLAIGNRDDAIVVEAEPATLGGGLDVDKVVAAVDVARVDEDAVELVVVALRAVGRVGEVLTQVNLEGVLVAVVDL